MLKVSGMSFEIMYSDGSGVELGVYLRPESEKSIYRLVIDGGTGERVKIELSYLPWLIESLKRIQAEEEDNDGK
jgi:hypothetical protein